MIEGGGGGEGGLMKEVVVCNKKWKLKGQLQRFYKLMSYERAFKMLKNDMCMYH